jgi:hypothetical protein
MSFTATGRKDHPAVTHATPQHLKPTPPLGAPPQTARRVPSAGVQQFAGAPVYNRPAQMQRVVVRVPFHPNGSPIVIETPTGRRYIESPQTEAYLKKEKQAFDRVTEADVKRQKKENSVLGKLGRTLRNAISGQTSGLNGSRQKLDKMRAKREKEAAEYALYGM